MLPCQGCAYRKPIPGNCHIGCSFAWTEETVAPLLKASHITKSTAQWFAFPFNYDPVWGPDECAQRSETLDPEKVTAANPLAELLAMFGS